MFWVVSMNTGICAIAQANRIPHNSWRTFTLKLHLHYSLDVLQMWTPVYLPAQVPSDRSRCGEVSLMRKLWLPNRVGCWLGCCPEFLHLIIGLVLWGQVVMKQEMMNIFHNMIFNCFGQSKLQYPEHDSMFSRCIDPCVVLLGCLESSTTMQHVAYVLWRQVSRQLSFLVTDSLLVTGNWSLKVKIIDQVTNVSIRLVLYMTNIP